MRFACQETKDHQHWWLIGPDGIPDRQEPYDTPTEAARAMVEFCERFRSQGYYKTARGEKIPWHAVHERCQIVAE